MGRISAGTRAAGGRARGTPLFIPIHDEDPADVPARSPWQPRAMLALLAIEAAVFIVVLATHTAVWAALAFGVVPAVLSGNAVLEPGIGVVPAWATLATYAFVHQGVIHLLGNLAFLWVFGDNVEAATGRWRFLLLFLGAAIAGAAVYTLTYPSSTRPLIGASGGVAGVIGAYLVLHPKVRLWGVALGFVPMRIRAAWIIGAWLVFQLWSAFGDARGDVAWVAHIAGFVAGGLLVVAVRRRGVPLFDRRATASR